MCVEDKIAETILGASTLVVTLAGTMLSQVQLPGLDGLLPIITQIGGPGLAVWLVYYHTTTTIPNAQKEFRLERAELVAAHAKQLNDKTEAFKIQLKELLEAHKEEIENLISKSYCRYKAE